MKYLSKSWEYTQQNDKKIEKRIDLWDEIWIAILNNEKKI
jgi:hypothetical protein